MKNTETGKRPYNRGDERRTESVYLRLTTLEREALDALCAQSGMSQARVIGALLKEAARR